MQWLRMPETLPFSRKPLPKKVVVSYILDYIVIIILAIVFLSIDKIDGYRQPFKLQDYTLQYPFATHERVPASMCYVYVVMLPAFIIVFWTLVIDGLFAHSKASADEGPGRRIGRYRLKDRLWELNCGILGLALSEGMAFVITGTFKNTVGRPRPDVISRCMPAANATEPLYGLSNSTICTQTDDSILRDGWRSFPSGHSSSSFAGMFYLSLYLAAKLHIWDSKGEVWKVFMVIVPSIGAGLIAATRIMDARHHPSDVVSGSLLGILCAYIAYRQYFPPVSETWRKGRAYPIRSWGKSTSPPTRAVSTSFRGASEENLEAQSLQQRSAHARADAHESLQPLAYPAASLPSGVGATSSPLAYVQRRDEWDDTSSGEDEDIELGHNLYSGSATDAMLNTHTAYVPRAHVATRPAEHV